MRSGASLSPRRFTQMPRLWAMTCKASQAALAANLPEGRWLRATPYLRSDRVLDLGVATVIGFQDEGLALAVADEGVVGEGGEERQLAAGARRYAAHDEPHREALLAEGGVGDLGHRGPGHEVGDRRPGLLGERGEPGVQAFLQPHGDG